MHIIWNSPFEANNLEKQGGGGGGILAYGERGAQGQKRLRTTGLDEGSRFVLTATNNKM